MYAVFELLVVLPLLSVVVPDLSIEAPPSVLPQRRYCDITGLEVRETSEIAVRCLHDLYRHRTRIQLLVFAFTIRVFMSSSKVWSVAAVSALLVADRGCMTQSTSAAKDYLSARGVNPIVK